MKSIIKSALLALIALQSVFCFAQKTQQYKFKMLGNKIFLETFLNGKGPYQFMFDSGASGIGRLDIVVVKSLQLKDAGEVENSDGHNTKTEKLAGLDSIRVGDVKLKNVKIMYRDYNLNPGQTRVDGIIGIDFFKNYVITIDFPNGVLELSKAHLSPKDEGVVAYQKPFEVYGTIGSVSCLFKFDTGSFVTFHLPEKVVNQVNHQPTGKKMSARRANTTFELKETVLEVPIAFGGKSFKNEKVVYSSLATWVNVGSAFLKHHKISFDQQRKLIRIQ